MNDILSQAADLLEQPNVWHQGSIAATTNGTPLRGPCHHLASKWCAVGAIEKAAGGYNNQALHARTALRDHLGVFSIAAWNDDISRTQAEVVAALREAAAK